MLILALLFVSSLTVHAEEPIFPLQADPEMLAMVSSEAPSFGTASPRIFEQPSIREIMKNVDADTLYVTDVDNTVLKSTQFLGSEPFGPWYMDAQKDVAPEVMVRKSWELFTRLRETAGTSELVDPAFASLLAEKRRSGTRAIALSAALLTYMPTRQKELAYRDVHFDALSKEPIDIIPGIVGFDRGAMLTSYQDKGESLVALLQKLGWLRSGDCHGGLVGNAQEWRPKKIVFVDDNLSLNVSVSRALSACDVPHEAFRYGAADDTWRTFEPAAAAVELDYFQRCARVMTDEEARVRVGKAPKECPREEEAVAAKVDASSAL